MRASVTKHAERPLAGLSVLKSIFFSSIKFFFFCATHLICLYIFENSCREKCCDAKIVRQRVDQCCQFRLVCRSSRRRTSIAHDAWRTVASKKKKKKKKKLPTHKTKSKQNYSYLTSCVLCMCVTFSF